MTVFLEKKSTAGETSGVIAPPPLIYLVFLGLGILVHLHFFLPILPDHLAPWVGWPTIALGILLLILSVREQWRIRTSINPYKPTTALATTGVYAWSRNPIYLGDAILYVGIGLVLNALLPLLLLPAAIAIMNWGVISREERYLEGKFGEEYRRYKEKVRRWL